MFIEVMGGKYPPPMAEVMEQSYPDEPKYCGDLGCGSGCWCAWSLPCLAASPA
jgi:hypothetical protein